MRWALLPSMLHGRMAFISGPRQIGKTTAVQQFLSRNKQENHYFNWDTPSVKKRYAKDPSFFIADIPPHLSQAWVALDEIHKYPKWKNILKGYYDEFHKRVSFVVTGSARLDLFRKSGDSLVGRYFHFRMLPLGVYELISKNPKRTSIWNPSEVLKSIPLASPEITEATHHLLSLTGYPEPAQVGTKTFYTRWQENLISLIMKEDLRDLTKITQLQKVETLLYLLPERVGSPLSLNSLAHPLEVTYGSVRDWLNALKLVYLVFSISPWTQNIARSIRKEQKYYFWDWGMIGDPGSRLENFVAVQLQRAIAYWNENGLGPFELRYIRTKDGREVDFVIVDGKKPLCLIEVKSKETSLSPHLTYISEKINPLLTLQVVDKKDFAVQKGSSLYILGLNRFLALLP